MKRCLSCGKKNKKSKKDPRICLKCQRKSSNNNPGRIISKKDYTNNFSKIPRVIRRYAIQIRSKKKTSSDWAYAIKYRDNFTCQKCGKKPKNSKDLQAHHIIPKRDDKSSIYDHDNGITLCNECHTIEDEKTKY